MKAIEKAIYTCMGPTDELYEKTESPLQRAILRTWSRHIHLEGAGMLEEITAPDMMVEDPLYRVGWGNNPTVIKGLQGVKDFYSSVGETLLWHSDDAIAVADWGVSDEITFHQVGKGSALAAAGYPTEDPDAYYHVTSRQAFIWPFDQNARVIGEHLYEDPTSIRVEPIDENELITPERSREIHREMLDDLYKRFGDKYWDYKYVQAEGLDI